MTEFTRLCKVSDVPDPGQKVFEVDERFIVLFRVGGRFYALDDACTHDGGPLGQGKLTGFEIMCPRHGARFDIRDGRALCLPAVQAVPLHEVKVEGEEVLVRLKEE
jgi:3-phenylpropionate/trans-cinnamate dioxygenase ferredoxin subunit